MATVTYEPDFDGPTTINHGDVVTITGPGNLGVRLASPFPGGAPIWDDGSSSQADVRDLWTDAWPKGCLDPVNDMQRRASGYRGVAAPHSRTNRYLAGAHAQNTPMTGYNVFVWRHFPNPANLDLYASCYYRDDPAWEFSGGANDDNHKNFMYVASNGTGGPYNLAQLLFVYAVPGYTSASDTTIKWFTGRQGNNLGGWFEITGNSLGSVYSPVADARNPTQAWTKYEFLIRTGNPGFIRLYENGRLVASMNGHVDTSVLTHRMFVFGSYARQYNRPQNVRYFTDLYLDTSFARVMLLSEGLFSSTLGVTEGVAATREIQPIHAWSASSIQFRVNLGSFGTAGTAGLYVVDATNTSVKVATVALDGAQPVETPPIITSYLAASGVESAPFSYQITATESPTSYDAENLPAGVGVDVGTGAVTGVPTETGDTIVPLTATNPAGSGNAPLALVIRPVIPSVGTGEKPTTVGAAPEIANPLTPDLVVSWLFNEGDDPTPAATLVNGGSGGATYDITMDYGVSGNYLWVPDGPSYALRSVVSANGERPLFPANTVTTGTTFTWECRYTPHGGNTTPWVFATGQTTTGSQGFIAHMVSGGKIGFHYNGESHFPTMAFTLNTEYHVGLVVEDGIGTWYVNGIARAVNLPLTNIPSLVLDRLFTNTPAGHSASFGATVNHMRFWANRALTAQEVESLFLDPYAMYGTASPQAPTISSSLTATADEDEPFVYGIVASPLPDSYDAINLPAGLQVDQDLGIIFGIPTESGVFPITLQVANDVGSNEETLTLTINAAPDPPEITSPLAAFGRVGDAFSYQITATNSPTAFDAYGDLP